MSDQGGDRSIDFGAIDAAHAPRPRTAIACNVVDGVAVLYDEDSGVCHRLDPIATVVWSRLGERTVAALIDELATEYTGDRTRIETDVLELVRHFGELGLLEGVRSRSEVAFAPLPAPAERRRDA